MAKRGSRSARQPVEWSGNLMTDAQEVAANTAAALGSSAALLQMLQEMTSPVIVRIHGEVSLWGQGGTAGDDVTVGMGLAVVSTRAFQSGAAALPRPLTDIAFPWMWHHMSHIRVYSAANTLTPDIGFTRVRVDCKAMRRVKSAEEELVQCIETSNGAGNGTIQFCGNHRILVRDGNA